MDDSRREIAILTPNFIYRHELPRSVVNLLHDVCDGFNGPHSHTESLSLGKWGSFPQLARGARAELSRSPESP